MAGNSLVLSSYIKPEVLGCSIANKWIEWDMLRANAKQSWKELRQYVYATDTTQTTNIKLPWKNKTTFPKLCQIRDNLFANYMATIFPKRKFVVWEGDDKQSEQKAKKDAIQNYTLWTIDRPEFKEEIEKLIYDYIDYGNCFVMPEWIDQRISLDQKTQTGYTGPAPRRICPLDITFNPLATSFKQSPKIIRSLVSLGEVKKQLEAFSTTEEEKQYNEDLMNYLLDLRYGTSNYADDIKDSFFQMDGFTSFRAYLECGYAELLTFYGDIYDEGNKEFYNNYEITIVDRHKILRKRPNPSFFGYAPIFHCGWRARQDNLWAQGPLDNLVGMQYRLDHMENMKADAGDLTTMPVLHIKGQVEDFEWAPFTRIIGDVDSDVKVVSPNMGNVLNVDMQLETLTKRMEEMAGAPKEAMGIRSPGEKTMYEVQRLENASSRMFTNKAALFEERIMEQYFNAAIELARRNQNPTMVRVMDDEFGLALFQSITPSDLMGAGRIRPLAARHYAEKAEKLQNMNNFVNSAAYADPAIAMHFGTVKMAKMFEELLDIEDNEIVEPFIRLTEQAQAQQLANTHEENTQMTALTPSGLTPDDSDQTFTS